MSRRNAISSLSIPCEAIKIILARTTSKYGNVYFPARRRNSLASAVVSLMTNGLFLGIRGPSGTAGVTMPYAAEVIKTIRRHINGKAY